MQNTAEKLNQGRKQDIDRDFLCRDSLCRKAQILTQKPRQKDMLNRKKKEFKMNCHGCKWLDRYKKDGEGYCCMVVRSKTQNEKIRRADMQRCELYKSGDWKTRWQTK